jgi:iron complex outermembrane receptor protein
MSNIQRYPTTGRLRTQKRCEPLTWIVMVLVTGGFAGPLAAQQTASAPEGAIEEVTITAQKRAERAQDVPVSITAISQDSLSQQGVRASSDLQAAIPSMTWTGGHNGSAYIRGVGSPITTAGNQSSVAFYEDGVLLISPLQANLAFNNVERVEVLKGPQGTLFGRNANGGVISIVTPDPSADPHATVSLGYGNYNAVEAKGYGNTRLTDTLSGNVAVYYYNQIDGWGRNETTGQEAYRARTNDVRAKLRWAPSDQGEIVFTFEHAFDHNEITANHILPGFLGAAGNPPPRSFYDTNNDFPTNNETTVNTGSVRASYDFGAATFREIASYTDIDTSWPFDSDAGPLNLIQGPITETASGFTNEMQLVSNDNKKFNWIVGLFYLNNDAAFAPIDLFGREFGPATIDVYGHTNAQSYAIFGQTTWEFVTDTHLTLGVRNTWDQRTVDGHTDVNKVKGTQAYQKASFREPTYRVGLDHRFAPELMVYGTVSTGFNSGQFNTGNAFAPAVKPEKMRAYEVGFKSDLLNGRLQVDAAAFWYDYKDLQVSITQNAVTLQTNAARARIKGGELEIKSLPFDRLHFDVGFSYTDAKYTQYNDAQFFVPLAGGGYTAAVGDATGNFLVATPKIGATANLSYEMDEFSASLSYGYKGKIYWSYQNNLFTDPYSLLGASLTYRPQVAQNMSLRLWGRNLTNSHYNQTEGIRPEGAMGAPGAPRMFGVTAEYKF